MKASFGFGSWVGFDHLKDDFNEISAQKFAEGGLF
jgi:hypothetical protein